MFKCKINVVSYVTITHGVFSFLFQEQRIRKIFSKPFSSIIPGYPLSGRFLGLRFSGPRRPLFDPDDSNALVVFAPPPISDHEKLKIDE